MKWKWPAVSTPTIVLGLGVLASAAANTQWAYDKGGDHVAYVAGVVATLLVPSAIHLWPKVPFAGSLTVRYWRGKSFELPVWRLLRALVMTLICAAAAYVNATHAVEVLTHRNWAFFTAAGLIIAVETVVVMASLARRKQTVQTKPRGRNAATSTAARPAGAATPKTPVTTAPARQNGERKPKTIGECKTDAERDELRATWAAAQATQRAKRNGHAQVVA